MNYNIETSESFDKEAKRLLKHYASFAGDYNKLLEELSQKPTTRNRSRRWSSQNSHEDYFQRKRQKWRRTGNLVHGYPVRARRHAQSSLYLRQIRTHLHQQERNRGVTPEKRVKVIYYRDLLFYIFSLPRFFTQKTHFIIH